MPRDGRTGLADALAQRCGAEFVLGSELGDDSPRVLPTEGVHRRFVPRLERVGRVVAGEVPVVRRLDQPLVFEPSEMVLNRPLGVLVSAEQLTEVNPRRRADFAEDGPP